MKKFKKISYIILVFIVIALSFMIYSSIARSSETDIKDKTFSELQYFESKLTYMFNSLNNIEFENYKILVEDISEKSKKSSQSSSGAGNSSEDSSSDKESESSSSKDSSSDNNNQNASSQDSSNKTKKYRLDIKGILNNDEKINWDYIKNEAELLDNLISTVVLDLYEISLNNIDILNFDKEYDNLLIAIKMENKEETLKELNLLYSYIPKFLKNCNKDTQYEIIINTKLNIFNAYGILDSEDWNSMSKSIQLATENFSKLLTDINLKNKNQYLVNKCYITLNNLQNAINKKDKELFLIKYKNLLEDLNNL